MKNQLAYLSGYIDGDGCFFLSNYGNKYRSKIVISSTHKTVLEFFQQNFGGSIQEVSRTKEYWKPQFHWSLGGVEFRKHIGSLSLIEKKEDSKIFNNFIESTSKSEKQIFMVAMKEIREKSKCITKSLVDEIKNISITEKLSELDFPYLAGFIDAECCLGISKFKPKNRPNLTYKIYLRCNNANPTIFYWLKERLGGSIVHIKRKHLNKNHSDQICWTLSGLALSKLLPNVYPFLITKKSVCQKLMDFYETTLENGGDRNSEGFKESYKDLLCLRESICNEVHVLNSKGSKNV